MRQQQGFAAGKRFAADAGRLAGVAGWLLGWTPDAFWHSTPAELAAVLRAMAELGAGAGANDAPAPPDAPMLARLKEMFPDG